MLKKALKRLFHVEAKGAYYHYRLFGERRRYSKKLALRMIARNQEQLASRLVPIGKAADDIAERVSALEKKQEKLAKAQEKTSALVKETQKRNREILKSYSALVNGAAAKRHAYSPAPLRRDESEDALRVVLVGDNRNRRNWGCRATSAALAEIIQRDCRIIHTITGRQTLTNTSIKNDFAWNDETLRDFVDENLDEAVEKLLAAIPVNPNLSELNLLDVDFDLLVVNGEGTMIMTTPPRRDTLVYLMLARWANSLGKKVAFVNTMFSDCPETGRNSEIVELSNEVLRDCWIVRTRDRTSLKYAEDNFKDVKAEFVPDALFSWIDDDVVNGGRLLDARFLVPFGYEDDLHLKGFDLSGAYICVTGGSRAAHDKEGATAAYVSLVNAMKRRFELPICLVQTCNGDSFLADVAAETQTYFIPVDAPILAGASLLANAAVFVGGRYHPSILASLGGTPCVFFGSNSHKTLSLQETLEYDDPHEYEALPAPQEFDAIFGEMEQKIAAGENERERIVSLTRALGERALGMLEE